MKNIQDKNSLYNLLEESNLQFFSSGVLNVNDPFFITRWNINSHYFQSSISYSQLKNESFKISFEDEELPRSWNQFGFSQSFLSDDHLNAPYHRNKHVELHYVAKGRFTLKVNQTLITLEEGDVCIINPHCYHSDIIGPEMGDLELYIIGINEEALRDQKEMIKNYPIFNRAFKSGNKSEYLLMRKASELEPFIRALEKNIKTLSFREDLSAFLAVLFEHEYTLFLEVETSRNTMLFEELQNFIHRNYRTVSLDDLEFYFNFSKDHMSRIIKEESGLTFNKYVQKIRVDHAKEYLKNTNLTIKDIMYKVGYKNETHFYRIFKEQVGLNPNQYRKTSE